MRTNDIEAVRDLLLDGLDAGGAIAEQTHAAIAKRSFDAVGPGAEPVRVMHDGIAAAVHRGVRGALRAATHHGGTALARRSNPAAAALTSRPAGAFAVGALNGLYGDHLARQASPLALAMTLHRDGAAVPATPAGLAAAFPDATGRVVVFVHGLGETEASWRLPRRRAAAPRVPFGERLEQELGFSALYLRFNSGLHISDNGRELAVLLDALTAHWPVAVDELVLVGHSMGGLVARSACHYAQADELAWTATVRHVFCLGTPHLGADLEKGVHLLSWALRQVPESRAIAGLLTSRSVGIKDLRHGSCAEEDWHGVDLDAFFRDRCREVPFLPDAHYYFVGATLAPGPLGHALGDLLVRAPSAAGQGRNRRLPFPADHGHTLTGLNHFDLLDHPAVYEQLSRWITQPAA